MCWELRHPNSFRPLCSGRGTGARECLSSLKSLSLSLQKCVPVLQEPNNPCCRVSHGVKCVCLSCGQYIHLFWVTFTNKCCYWWSDVFETVLARRNVVWCPSFLDVELFNHPWKRISQNDQAMGCCVHWARVMKHARIDPQGFHLCSFHKSMMRFFIVQKGTSVTVVECLSLCCRPLWNRTNT